MNKADVKKFDWKKLKAPAQFIMMAFGIFMILVAPRQFPTIPVWLYYLGMACIVGFVGWNVYLAYMEYYRKEVKKGWRNKRKAIRNGIIIIVATIALFVGIKFSGLPEKILPQYYDNEQPAELNEAP